MSSTPESVTDLLERLEALLRRGIAPPSPDKKTMTERELAGLVQKIRASLPGELREVHRLRAEAERLHRGAQDEARRLVLEAQATAQRLIDQGAVLKDAERRSRDLLQLAERDARSVRDGADAYARQVLRELEERVLRVLDVIRKGRELLKDRDA